MAQKAKVLDIIPPFPLTITELSQESAVRHFLNGSHDEVIVTRFNSLVNGSYVDCQGECGIMSSTFAFCAIDLSSTRWSFLFRERTLLGSLNSLHSDINNVAM